MMIEKKAFLVKRVFARLKSAEWISALRIMMQKTFYQKRNFKNAATRGVL